jgi:hypothetical protein
VPVRLVGGSPFWAASPKTFAGLRNVLVKLLIVRDVSQFFLYLDTGEWTGARWPHITEFLNAPDRWSLTDQMGYLSEARPGNVHFGDWQQTPSVDRTRVKIKRFDYFGHSGQDQENALFLQYGWTNKKGELAAGEDVINVSELQPHLSRANLAPGSFAKLWGCHATATMAPMLATFFDTVEACSEFVDYTGILVGDQMPVPRDPVNAPFQVFKRQP